MFDPRYFVRFDFVVCKAITNIPFYRGKHLNTLFRVLFDPYLKQLDEPGELADFGIRTIPTANGEANLYPGDEISVILSFPPNFKDIVQCIINSLRDNNVTHYNFPYYSHFNPQKTISFHSAICCQSSKEWSSNSQPVTADDLKAEVLKLSTLRKFTINIYTPLILKRFEKIKGDYLYFDQEYFTADRFLTALTKTVDFNKSDLEIIEKHFSLIKCIYQPNPPDKKKQYIRGICGFAVFQGKVSIKTAEALVYGQYSKLGKHSTIGFGCYVIDELRTANKIVFEKKTSWLKKIITPANLRQTLAKMNNHSPGPDGITVEDLKETSDSYLHLLSEMIHKKTFQPSETIDYKKIKYNNQVRIISISNMTDRLAAKLISDRLSKIIDPILSDQAYAYRQGRSVQQAVKFVQKCLNEGFCNIIKADVKNFFPSIKKANLFRFMKAVLNNDEIVSFIETLYSKQTDLTQGNPLSPLLSNLYMKVFDDLLCSRDHRYIRFADDIVIMSRDETILESMKLKIIRYLALLKLDLNEAKTDILPNADSIEFLGHKISKSRIIKIPTKKTTTQEFYQWLPVFNYNYRKGIAVYVTFKTHMVRTEDTKIVIHKANESQESIPWSQINRFVVIGRARISAGAIRKAMYYNLPVNFLSIKGKNIGSFNPNNRLYNVKDIYSSQFYSYEDFQLSFIRSIVDIKIHNQKMILTRRKIKEPKLLSYQKKISKLTDIDEIRGYEGAASNLYFKHLRELVKPFSFEKREYHPAIGPVNVMLSIGYSLIYNRIGEALMSSGLNPYYGIYHYPRGRHMALASDLVECFRFIAERVMLSLINLKKLKTEDFIDVEGERSSYTKLIGDGYRTYLHRFEWIMNQEIKLQDESKPMKYEQLFDLMVNRLIRSMRLGIEFKPVKVR